MEGGHSRGRDGSSKAPAANANFSKLTRAICSPGSRQDGAGNRRVRCQSSCSR